MVARGGEHREAGSVDLRPRLAPGEVDGEAGARTSKGFRSTTSLSKVSPNNPVLLTHASGHASFANAKAMELSGVTGKTANPPGGDFIKDAKGNPTGLFRETASRLIRRGAGEPPRTPDEERARGPQGARARVRGGRRQGHHVVPGRRLVVRDRRSHEGDDRRGQDERAALDHAARWTTSRSPPNLDKYKTIDYGQRLPHRARDQEIDRRRARAARRVAARAVLGQARRHRPQHRDRSRTITRDRPPRDAARLPALRPRHRRPRQPRDAEHLRGGIQGEPRQEGPALARRARPAPSRLRHPPLRPARRDRVDARRALHVGCALRAGAARAAARRGRRVRVAEADEVRRHRSPTAPTRRSRTSIRSRATTRPSAAS